MTSDQIRTMFRAVDASDWEALAAFLHPDLVYDRPGADLMVGRESVILFYREVRTLRGAHQFDAVVSDRAHGAAWGRFIGTNAAGPVDVQFADCYTFRDGLLWRRKSFFYVPVV
jgi:hypothetical protein